MSLILGRVAQLDPSMVNTNTTFLTSYKNEEEKYNSALEDSNKRRILELNGHIPNNMSYRVNNYGFRGDDWDIGTDCDVTLGNSNTWGGGNYEENIYPTLISKQTGRTVYNLGYPAGTADGVFRYAVYWLPILKPKTVYTLFPSPKRSELIRVHKETGELYHTHWSWSERNRNVRKDLWLAKETYYWKWFSNDANSLLNNLKNMLALRQICDNIGAELRLSRSYYITMADLPEEYQQQSTYEIQDGHWPIGDIGRDFKHRGKLFHKLISERLLSTNDYDTEVNTLTEKIYGTETLSK